MWRRTRPVVLARAGGANGRHQPPGRLTERRPVGHRREGVRVGGLGSMGSSPKGPSARGRWSAALTEQVAPGSCGRPLRNLALRHAEPGQDRADPRARPISGLRPPGLAQPAPPGHDPALLDPQDPQRRQRGGTRPQPPIRRAEGPSPAAGSSPPARSATTTSTRCGLPGLDHSRPALSLRVQLIRGPLIAAKESTVRVAQSHGPGAARTRRRGNAQPFSTSEAS